MSEIQNELMNSNDNDDDNIREMVDSYESTKQVICPVCIRFIYI